jgi:hypothetical protein
MRSISRAFHRRDALGNIHMTGPEADFRVRAFDVRFLYRTGRMSASRQELPIMEVRFCRMNWPRLRKTERLPAVYPLPIR